MKAVIAALLYLLLLFSAQAENPKTTITLRHVGDDRVGGQIFYRFGEEVRRSSLFEQTDEINARMRATLHTMDVDMEESRNDLSAYALVVSIEDPWTLSWVEFNHYIGVCGSAKVDSCATTLVASLANYSEQSWATFDEMRKRKPLTVPK